MPIETKLLEPGVVLITLSGRLVMGKEIERLENVVKELLVQDQQKVFVFDLSTLDYADSSGIGTFVACLTAIKKRGGEMRLAGANARIQRLFKLTGVDHLLSQFPTVAAATAG
ncbi:MAG: STAS domain-containing protein [Candidatus Sulfopaludibacter sp.]|nr:STAS domain-containing protein [Candidatus Sulfopaludibacter sp.]